MRHAACARLVSLGTTYASILLAIFCGILLAATWDNRWGTSLVASVLAASPWLCLRWLDLPRQLGHAARGRALVVLPHGLACASEQFARLIPSRAANLPTLQTIGRAPWPARVALGPVLGLLLTPGLNYLFFPGVRVLNFTDRSIDVFVDGRRLCTVLPTSGENPEAGKIVHAPSGRHRLRAQFADGTLASDARVEIRSGFQHLYAPGAASGCFYLQRVSYGVSRFEGPKIIPLDSSQRFWAIGSDVDSWFTPETALRSGATTGGVVTLLRMGNCR
jgi:hypothetical protein